uniref:DNA-(apurinic or apyrimidinic site) lyase n=1 Tax=Auxenochlorella protothecoides TaxID=3075 RepID=A0A1D1ZV89_AUXPR
MLRVWRRLAPSSGCPRPTYRGLRSTPVVMVEGHQCHRVAHAHRRQLLGRRFKASSPNGRFTDGAAALHDQPLHRIEVHGKYLFYFFGTDPKDPIVLHFHFGMSGAFRTTALPGPEPTATTRLQLLDQEAGTVSHLSAMTVLHGSRDLYDAKRSKLGPDPLREDADEELVWSTVSTSKKSIGLLLMDQSVVAGIGNIYRAEILYKAGVHPEQPGNTLSVEAFQRLWRHSVLLLQRGFATGSILTVDEGEAPSLGPAWARRYIYNQARCGRCGGRVATWDMAGRTVYACARCQPLQAGTELAEGRRAAVAAAAPAREFLSHCAPEDPAALGSPKKMTVAGLRAALGALGADTAGRKAALAARLAERRALGFVEAAPGGVKREDGAQVPPQAADLAVPSPPAPAASPAPGKAPGKQRGAFPGPRLPAMPPPVTPGIAALLDTPIKLGELGRRRRSRPVASAQEALLEKLEAGEGPGVEHVALEDDATEALKARASVGDPARRPRRTTGRAQPGPGA